MTQWYDRNYSNPYPTFRDCEVLAQNGGITIEQVKQWFVNVRRRTQNQFRKQRTSYNLKRKSDEFQDENGIDISYENLQQPKARKPKVEQNELSYSNTEKTATPGFTSNMPYYYGYDYNSYYNNTYNQTNSQYFDQSSHFKPYFNNSYDSNISFDFTSTASSNSPTIYKDSSSYNPIIFDADKNDQIQPATSSPTVSNSYNTNSYFNYNYAFNSSPVAFAKPASNQYYYNY